MNQLNRMLLIVALGGLAACGGGSNCVDLCTEAQAGNCTAITGNCGSFCSALDSVQGPASCTSQREAYEACLDNGAVCSNSCSSQEAALSNCVGAYCLTRQSEPSCATLIASF